MSPMRLASLAPPQNTPVALTGRANASIIQAAAVSSIAAAVGDITGSAPFWSQAEAIAAAAMATGWAPPVTNPK